jgi:hypothetical protein
MIAQLRRIFHRHPPVEPTEAERERREFLEREREMAARMERLRLQLEVQSIRKLANDELG